VSGYIGRHWRGELSLPRSYWIDGALVLLPFNFYFRVMEFVVVANPPHSPLAFVYLFLGPILLLIPISVWAGVGIWRSAGRRIAEGSKGWAWIARAIVLINIPIVALLLINTARFTYSSIVAYEFESAAGYRIIEHKHAVIFHGHITEAAGDNLVAALDKPDVGRLVINGSIGGFLRPAMRVAEKIRERKLFVVALAQCESACTILLAAGQVRAVEPDTETGFHRGSLMGLTQGAPEDLQADKYYAAAGMSSALIATIRSHAGPDDLYDPALKVLIEDGFVTEIYDRNSGVYFPAHDWCQSQPAQCARSGRANRKQRH
jgi:hypothetical protein